MRRTSSRRRLAFALLVCACTRPAAHQPAPAAAPAGANIAWKPVSFAILEDYDLGADLDGVARDFGLFRQLGVRTWRGSISWLQVEPQRGRRDFTWLHRFAQLAADSGITLRPYIAYTPEWAARGGRDHDAWNDPPRSITDWTAFVTALATEMRRHRNVRSFEIFNEENTAQWWDGSPASYDSILAAGAAAIRQAAPGMQVILGGMVWPDASWVDHACSMARVDVVPFHAYPETWTPDSVTVETFLHDFGYKTFLPVERSECRNAAVWVNETGFATMPGKSERDQAFWWARAIPTFLAEPAIQHVGIYEIKDLRPSRGAIGGAANYHLGITDTVRRPKLAFHTVRLLVRLLAIDSLAVIDSALVTNVVGSAEPIAGFDGATLTLTLRPRDVRIIEILP